MVGHYLKFAIRNIMRNRTYAAINIVGLAVSLTAFILMALYIENELSFDRFNANANRIYRIADDKQTPDVILRSAKTAAPVAPALLEDFPQITEAVRMIGAEALVKYNEQLFEERNLFFADASIFSVFSFGMLQGNPASALKDPGSVVLTRAMKEKYFGDNEPLGKIIQLDGKPMTVTGVINNIPGNSHLNFDFLISMSTAQQQGSGYDWMFTNWYSTNFYTYILLPEKYEVNKLTAGLKDFDMRHKEKGSNTIHNYALEKLTDIYLHSDRDDQVGKTSSLSNLYIFSVIAFFILLIACVNFINITTSRAVTRAKEIGVKKVAGALRSQMIAQFLTESFLMTIISFIVGLILVFLLMPSFNIFSGKQLTVAIFSHSHLTALLVLFFSIALLSAAYPAFVSSGFKPAAALKDKISTPSWNPGIKKGLVVFQFTISVILIVCSIVVYQQMNYLQSHDLGFKMAQTMVINFEGDRQVQQKLKLIKDELKKVSGVENVSASSNVPGDGNASSWSMDFIKKNGDTIHTELPIYLTDFNYLQLYHIPVVAGSSFSNQYADDSISSMLISETALKKLGFASAGDAIGVKVGMYPVDAKITGVFKDFHFESLQKAIAPLVIRSVPFKYRLLSVAISTAAIRQTINGIEKQWKKIVPERPLEYSFLDVSFNKQYLSQIKFGQVFALFTILAIVIACLGLFGLALFSVQQRKKEISIRKVLGASLAGITIVLSKDFITLIVIAILIASPIAWYGMHQWLQDFAFRINISGWVFVLAGVAAIFIAVATVSFQAIKAALMNPVKSLKSE